MSAPPPICPVCHAPATRVKDLSRTAIRDTLTRLFRAPVPAEIPIPDYVIYACTTCELAFADPMKAGDAAFYGWITGFTRYQSGGRWEWGVIREHLKATGAQRLLEVGAGTGALMAELGDIAGLSCVGIDVSAASVAQAQANGFDVREAAFSELNRVLDPTESFDAIVLSHVLEHVDDPLGVMKTLLNHLAPGGHIMAAVPYSPMSREMRTWDIMNLPPHHLTRWNARALEALANQLDCRLELHVSKAKSPLKRAVQDTCGDVLGNPTPSAWWRVAAVLGHMGIFRDYLARHRARERVNGRPAGDSVLAVFAR